MKKILLSLSIALVALVATTSCTKDKTSSNAEAADKSGFLGETAPAVYINSSSVYKFDKTLDQVVYNSDLSQYCITNTDYSEQVTLTIEGELTKGNKVNVSYKSSGIEGLGEGNNSMEVVKAEGNNYYLWDNGTGILVVAY